MTDAPGSPPTPPPRVRVTSPRAGATRQRRTTVASEIDAQTGIGEVYMSSLLRTQLRLGLLVLAALGVLVAGLPALFALAPGLADVDVLGVPLPWLLLAFGVYPVLIALGWAYVRAAERNELAFAEVVAPSGRDDRD